MRNEFFALLEETGKEVNYDLVDIEFENNSIFIKDGMGVSEENLVIGQEGKTFYEVYEAYEFLDKNGMLK